MDQKTIEKYELFMMYLKTQLMSVEFLNRHRRKAEDFSRQRTLTFDIVVLFLINMNKRALQDELDEFFKALTQKQIAQRIVTKGAFTKVRKKLKHTAFIELNQSQIAYYL